MNVPIKMIANDAHLELIYRVLLGREVDPGIWINECISSVVEGVVCSTEFDLLWQSLDLSATMPDRIRNQSSEQLRRAIAILQEIGCEPAQSWRTATIALLTKALSVDMTKKFKHILDLLEHAVKDEINIDTFLFEMLYSEDIAKGVKEGEGAEEANRVLKVDWTAIREGLIDASLLTSTRDNAPLRKILTLNSDGLSRDQLARRLMRALKNGTIEHWLFNAEFYLRERAKAFAEERVTPWTPIDAPYLDFLVFGDENDLRPHPLFSAFSYRKLNEGGVDLKRCFRHFLTEGQFKGYRTSAIFDERFYREVNQFVARDMARLNYTSALEHFCRDGQRGNLRYSPDIDENFYSSYFPDVIQGIERREITSGAAHFLWNGLLEGRSPNAYFDTAYYLSRYPWVGKECGDWMLAPLEHFLLLGHAENWRPAKLLADRELDMLQAKGLYERRAALALHRSNLNVRDFSAFAGPDPILSVIVPIHNQLPFTARFLELASAACLQVKVEFGRAVEIILVSNGSIDGTNEWIRELAGVQAIVETAGLGYPKAVNRGALNATGKYLLITNNDIEFEPDSFTSLIRKLEDDTSIGAVGPLVLSMDGTVQESGSFIGGDGGSFGRGRGELAQYKPWWTSEDVDYVSGCFLMISKDDYESLEGLDENFTPGYYEEVDLCMRIRKDLRKRVVFDPSTIIYHYEHASFTKGRPPAVSLPTVIRNRRSFLTKHRDIRGRPSVGQLQSLPKLSKIGFKFNRLLIIEDLIPDPRLGSGFGREAEILNVLKKFGVPYDIMALHPTRKVDEYGMRDVRVFRNWMPGETLSEVLDASAGRYSHLWICRTHNLSQYAQILQSYKERHEAHIVCDTEALGSLRELEALRICGRSPSESAARDMIEAEMEYAHVADHIIAVNKLDEGVLRSLGLTNVSIIGHSVSGGADENIAFAERSRLLLVGAIHARQSPNYDGAVWFFENVVPKINLEGLTLTIVGSWDDDLVAEFQSRFDTANCDFAGMVSDHELNRLYAESRAAIAPTRFAAGVPCKVVEAMLKGVPIVLTEVLAKQLGIVQSDWKELAVAGHEDEGVAFASFLRSLLEDEPQWNLTRDAQRDFAVLNFNTDVFSNQVSETLRAIGISEQPVRSNESTSGSI